MQERLRVFSQKGMLPLGTWAHNPKKNNLLTKNQLNKIDFRQNKKAFQQKGKSQKDFIICNSLETFFLQLF